MLKKFFSSKTNKIYTIIVGAAVILCLIIVLVTAFASDANRLVYGENQDGTYYIKDIKSIYRGGIFHKESLVIPATHNGEKVVSIEKLESDHITEIVIEEGIEEIKTGAFTGMEALVKITIPESVKVIGGNTFSNCYSLKEIVFPNHIKAIESQTFRGCKSLETFTVPSSVNYIGENAFAGCTSLTEVVLSSGVESIGNQAFKECSNLKTLAIPTTVNYVGESAFEGCSSLETLSISEGLPKIDKYAFAGMSGLKSITIPSTVTEIGEGAFMNCTALTSIVVPQGVTRIENSTFENCTLLATISLPSGITFVGDKAFANCVGLESLELSEVSEIGNGAFNGATKLETINCTFNQAKVGTNAFDGTEFAKNLLKDNKGLLIIDNVLYDFDSEVYKSENNITGTIDTLSIPNGVTKINKGAFYDSVDFKAIVLPESVKVIEAEAFALSTKASDSLTKLNVVYFANVELTIGEKAFNGCKELKAKVFVSEESVDLLTVEDNNSVFEKAKNVFVRGEEFYTYVYLTKEDSQKKVESELLYDLVEFKAYKLENNTKKYFNERTYKFE